MGRHAERLSALGQGQRVRLTFADGDATVLRVNQLKRSPDDALWLELTSEDADDVGRYLLETRADDDTASGLSVDRYDRTDDAWRALANVTGVEPMGMFRTVKSSDMEAQAGTGTER